MARISPSLVVVLAVIASAYSLALQEPTTKVPETTKSPIEDPVTGNGVDFADIQNAEDDDEQYRADCSGGEAYLRHPRNCGLFYQCAHGVAHLMRCPAGLYFHLAIRVCDWPQNVNCQNVGDRCTYRRIGRSSGSADDAVSTARCPSGSVPVSCISTDPRNSDGNYITGRDCQAYNSFGSSGQRAVATCVNVEDDTEYVFPTSGDFERSPVVNCPVNYRIVNCVLRNPWAPDSYAFAQINPGRDDCCSDVPCAVGRGCFVQAVCRRKNFPR